MRTLEKTFLLVFQMPVNDELMWDNGTAYPEPCIDRIADTVGKVSSLLLLIEIWH